MRISNILSEKLSRHKIPSFFPNMKSISCWEIVWMTKYCHVPWWLRLSSWLFSPSICDVYFYFIFVWLTSLIFKMHLGGLPLESSSQLQMRVSHKNQMINDYCVSDVTAELYLTMFLEGFFLSSRCCRELVIYKLFFLLG